MVPLLAAVLVLQPMLAEAGPLRLVAVGTGLDPVEWTLDGAFVATTLNGSAIAVNATAGTHTVVARTFHDGSWSALVRSEPTRPGVQYVPAWTAHWDGPPAAAEPGKVPLTAPVAAILAGVLAMLGWRQMLRRRRAGISPDF